MVLSDLGADVIRIDRVTDVGREPEPGIETMTAGILTRGRRSLAIDLKHPRGVETALKLVRTSDALVEGFRPGVMERLGLGPDVCLQENKRLAYGRITGWGQQGPLAQAAGHDLNFIALSGLLAAIGRRGDCPPPPLNVIGDFAGGGLLLAMGLIAALLETQRSGVGQVVDAAMVDGAAYLMTMMYELLGRGAWVEERQSNANDGGAHFYDVYETADGRFIAIAPMEPKFYATLLELTGEGDTESGKQWDAAEWPRAKERFAAIFRKRTREEWCEMLEGSDACFAPVLTMTEALEHPHNTERRMFTKVDGIFEPAPAPRFSRTPSPQLRPSALPGADTDRVLLDCGLTEQEIAQLRGQGAIA